MDLITDLLLVEGYNFILVVVDRGLLKGVILCPCAKTITWEGTATLCNNLFERFGLPDEIISDRDPRFAAHTFQELLKLSNIKLNLTTAYHPQSDGATERVNQEIEAHHTQKIGYIHSALWNSHTIIEDMLNKFIPHLN
jgi:transposase InsO family protein